MKDEDPKAYVNLVAISMIDEESLKLHCAGNPSTMQIFIDKAYSMELDEVAALLNLFTGALERFSLIRSGCSPEMVNQIEDGKKKELSKKLASLLPAESPAPLEDSKQL